MEERVRYAAKVEEVMRWQESRIQVLLVDSDPVWQQRLTALIDAEPDMSISHIATNKESAIRASMQLDLDVMIHDPVLHSSQQDGLDTIAEVLKIKSLPIIILTSLYQPRSLWMQCWPERSIILPRSIMWMSQVPSGKRIKGNPPFTPMLHPSSVMKLDLLSEGNCIEC